MPINEDAVETIRGIESLVGEIRREIRIKKPDTVALIVRDLIHEAETLVDQIGAQKKGNL